MKWLTGLAFLICFSRAGAQGLVDAPPENSRVNVNALAREQAIAPALVAMREGRNADAVGILKALLPAYPRDGRMFMLLSQASHGSGNDVDALAYLKKTVETERPDHPIWHIHMEIVPLYAANGDWDDFDRERAKIRDAAKANPAILKNVVGYAIETIHQAGKDIQVMEFPLLFGRFHTRYRFVFPADVEGSTWKPFVDCESDDIDQVSFAKSIQRKPLGETAAFLWMGTLVQICTPR